MQAALNILACLLPCKNTSDFWTFVIVQFFGLLWQNIDGTEKMWYLENSYGVINKFWQLPVFCGKISKL